MAVNMQNGVRTTIRVRKDLMDQSRLLAFEKGTSVQDVINSTLAAGFGNVINLKIRHEAFDRIESFRKSLIGKNIDAEKLLAQNKKDLK